MSHLRLVPDLPNTEVQSDPKFERWLRESGYADSLVDIREQLKISYYIEGFNAAAEAVLMGMVQFEQVDSRHVDNVIEAMKTFLIMALPDEEDDDDDYLRPATTKPASSIREAAKLFQRKNLSPEEAECVRVIQRVLKQIKPLNSVSEDHLLKRAFRVVNPNFQRRLKSVNDTSQ